MLEELTSSQITEWLAYNELEPIGEWRGDFRIAILCSVIVNLAGAAWGRKGKHKIATPADFMPDWGRRVIEPEVEQSVEEMKQVVKSIARSAVKKDRKKK